MVTRQKRNALFVNVSEDRTTSDVWAIVKWLNVGLVLGSVLFYAVFNTELSFGMLCGSLLVAVVDAIVMRVRNGE